MRTVGHASSAKTRHACLRWSLGAGALILYTVTCCPTVHWGDSGELIFAGAVLGVAHPPGHPLYSILAHAFTWLPFGHVAWRVNWMSACFGAVTIVLVFEMATETLRRLGTPFRRASAVAAFAAAMLALTSGVWGGATVAETTTLHAAFMTALFWLVWRIAWIRPAGPVLTLALGAAAALYGFSATNHVAGVLFLPALAVLVVWRGGWHVLRPRNVAVMFACVFAGLSLYAFLYLRSRQDPVLDWGNPETLANFWWVVSAQQFQSGMAQRELGAGAWHALGYRGVVIVNEWTMAGAALVVIGLLTLARRVPWAAVFIVLCIAPLIGLGLSAAFILAYFVPALVLLAVALAVGTDRLMRWLPPTRRTVAAAPAVGVLLWSGTLHYSASALQSDRSAEAYGRAILDRLPPNTVYFPTAGDQAFIFWGLQSTEGYRTDVAIINPTWGATNYPPRESLEQQYPHLTFLTPDKLEPYERRWQLPRSSGDLRLAAVVHANSAHQPIYIGVPVTETVLKHQLEPRGDVMRFHETPGDYLSNNALAATRDYWEQWLKRLDDEPDLRTPFLTEALGNDLNNQGKFFESLGRSDLARWNYDAAIRVNPRAITPYLNRGRLHGHAGDWRAARTDFDSAVAINPRHAGAQYLLGTAYEALNEPEAAFRAYLETLLWNPNDTDAMRRLGLLLLRVDELERARDYLRRALARNPDDADAARGMLLVLLRQSDRPLPTTGNDEAALMAVAHQLAREAMGAGNFDAASTAVQCARALWPNRAETYILMAEYAARSGQPNAAALLEIASEMDPALTERLTADTDWARDVLAAGADSTT